MKVYKKSCFEDFRLTASQIFVGFEMNLCRKICIKYCIVRRTSNELSRKGKSLSFSLHLPHTLLFFWISMSESNHVSFLPSVVRSFEFECMFSWEQSRLVLSQKVSRGGRKKKFLIEICILFFPLFSFFRERRRSKWKIEFEIFSFFQDERIRISAYINTNNSGVLFHSLNWST